MTWDAHADNSKAHPSQFDLRQKPYGMNSPANNNPDDPSRFINGQNSAFMLVPSCFWQNLSPEQFKSQQQIYQTAYEKARQNLGSEAPDDGVISFDI